MTNTSSGGRTDSKSGSVCVCDVGVNCGRYNIRLSRYLTAHHQKVSRGSAVTSQTQGPPFIPREFPTRPSDSERLKKLEEELAATKAKCISTIDLDGAQEDNTLHNP